MLHWWGKKGKVCKWAKCINRPGLIPVFLGWSDYEYFYSPPPGWDASPSQGYSPALNLPIPIYTLGWREALWEQSVSPKNTTQCPQWELEHRLCVVYIIQKDGATLLVGAWLCEKQQNKLVEWKVLIDTIRIRCHVLCVGQVFTRLTKFDRFHTIDN